MATKTCTSCRNEKPISEFYRSKLGAQGRASRCKPCVAEITSARNKKLRQEQPERVRARQAAWREANPERLRELKRADYLKRVDVVKAKSTEWQRANRERRRATQKAWRDANREKVRGSQRAARARLLKTAKGRLEQGVKSTFSSSLRGAGRGGRRTFELLGYSSADLMAHLEARFRPGMSWENYGRGGWHVDHIIPLSKFLYASPDDAGFKLAWALSNLQPLWEPENWQKNNRVDTTALEALSEDDRLHLRAA